MSRREHGPVCAVGVLALAALCGSGCRATSVGVAECAAGRIYFVGCGCEGIGVCSEELDPVLRVCDGARPPSECGWDTQLAENDDGGGSCGHCPGVRVRCPDSGRLLVVPRARYPDEIVVCDWGLREEPE